MSMGEFVEEATEDLLLYAQEISGGKAVPPACSGDGAATVARHVLDKDDLKEVKEAGRTSSIKKRVLFNSDKYKSARMDLSLGHFPEKSETSSKLCAFCEKRSRQIRCSICGVTLCHDDLCFTEWHTCSNL
jgi:hypothetical protein